MSNTTTRYVITIVTAVWLYTLARSLLIMLCGKNIFKKARKGEKTALLPVINLFTMLEVADINTFWGILLFVPGINLIILLVMSSKLGKVFNVSGIYRFGLMFIPIMFYPLLANSNYQYKISDEEYFKQFDNAKEDSINLMTEAEIKKINETTTEEESYKDVDSIFKSDIAQMEQVAPYKAAKIDLLGMEKIKKAPMEDDIFRPIKRQEVKPLEEVKEEKTEIKENTQTVNNTTTEENKDKEKSLFVE